MRAGVGGASRKLRPIWTTELIGNPPTPPPPSPEKKQPNTRLCRRCLNESEKSSINSILIYNEDQPAKEGVAKR